MLATDVLPTCYRRNNQTQIVFLSAESDELLGESNSIIVIRTRRKPSGIHLMSGKLSSLRKRLDQLEQRMADRERRAELANCTCTYLTLANPFQPEDFEAEMNLPCPAHGFRRLGRVCRIRFRDGDGTEEPSPRLDELLAIYDARLEQANRKLANVSQES
jgi:hypothetical protein